MTTARLAILFSLIVTAAFAQSAAAQTNPNPLYAAWARTKLGTTVVHTGSSKTMGLETAIETTSRLQSIAPDRVTLEVTRTVTMAGKDPETTKKTYDIRATLADAEKLTLAGDANEIAVGGKTYRCKVYQNISQAGELKIATQYWISDDVPGGVVKIDSRTEGPIAMSSTIDFKEAK